MRDTMEQGAQVDFPVDDGTYNLMTTLTEKLQALDTYRIYAEDVEGPELELYQELIDEDTRHAQRIWEVLKERISRS
jgi:rubrerythrin